MDRPQRQRPGDPGRQGHRREGPDRRRGAGQYAQPRVPEPLQGHRRRARGLAHRRGRDPRDRRGDERRGDLHRLARLLHRGDAQRPDDAARLHGRPARHRASARRTARLPRLGRARPARPCDARAAPRGLPSRSLVHPAGRGARPDQRARKRVRQRPRHAERAARAGQSAHDDDRGADPRQGVRRRAGLPDHDPPGGVRRGARARGTSAGARARSRSSRRSASSAPSSSLPTARSSTTPSSRRSHAPGRRSRTTLSATATAVSRSRRSWRCSRWGSTSAWPSTERP